MTPANDPGGSAGVGTELTNKGTIRQKRWTTRGRTGCLTCRARHIKCDETKPACRRCATGRRECRGYDFGCDPDTLTVVAARQSKEEARTDAQCIRHLVQEAVARRHYIDEPEPPDWECMEAARYYLVFVLPCCNEQFMAPFTGLPPCHGPNRPIFLLDVSCHRIADASRARGRLLRAREDASVDGAWATHSRHMIQILSAVNRGIADKDGLLSRSKKEALRRILTLLYFDLIVDASTWRPHLVGYLALAQHMGGVRALMRENDAYVNRTQWSMLVIAIAANTTSPASKQLCGFEAYTDDDVLLLSALDTSPDLACPPPLLIIVKNLTQLRGRIADGRCTKISLNTELRDLFDQIGAFDYNAWAKQVHSTPEAVIATLSHVFQVAVRLFGVLSLPHSATVSWALAAGYQRLPGMSMYDSVRIAHRCELLNMLYRFRGRFRTALALAWPVTVAGVSLGGDGSAEDRTFVAEALLDMWRSRLARCGPVLCLQKLRGFWDSGKTEWDDCFDEPVPPLARHNASRTESQPRRPLGAAASSPPDQQLCSDQPIAHFLGNDHPKAPSSSSLSQVMACQILLDFSPRSSSSSSSSNSSLDLGGGGGGPEAPLGRTQTGAVRRRRWAPRARTGCLTCRARRVKCDEERPICRRCASSRVTCRGYQTPSPTQGKARKNTLDCSSSSHQHMLQTPPESPSHRSETTALLSLGSVHQHHINIETEPPDWDLQEGIRYYFQVVVPGRSAEVRSGGHPNFHAKSFYHARFLSQVIGDRISRASKARGALIQPGHHPAFAGVWATYARYLSASIAIVNRHIQDAGGGGGGTAWRRVLYGIDQLLVLDLYVERSQWQAHLGAFFAYIRHRGGVAAMLDQPEPPFYCLNHVLIIAINVNTTSPARQQVHGFDDYADHQLVSILESAYSTSMQCPTELYIAMVHISRLRAALAHPNGKLDQTAVEQQVRCILASIGRFDADAWAAGPAFNDKRDTVAKVGRIYASAVRLYGIMTLPPSAAASCVMPPASGLEGQQPAAHTMEEHQQPATHGTLRTRQRDELLALTRRSWGQLRHTTSLCWPLIVAGVALADGSPQDQDFIETSLLSIWSLPNTSACFITAIQRLRPFWDSGKTGWEDCFDTPLACVV